MLTAQRIRCLPAFSMVPVPNLSAVCQCSRAYHSMNDAMAHMCKFCGRLISAMTPLAAA